MNDFEWELTHVYKADHQATDLFGPMVDSIIKSIAPYESITKTWYTHEPDRYSFSETSRKHPNIDPVKLAGRLMSETYRKYPDRFSFVDKGNQVWAAENQSGKDEYDKSRHYDHTFFSEDRDPKDMWGYVTQPGDSSISFAKPVFDKEQFINAFPQKLDERIKNVSLMSDEPLDKIINATNHMKHPKFTDSMSGFGYNNAKRAYELGVQSGHNGPADMDLVRKMVIKNVADALNSGDSDRYNAALMFSNFYPYMPQTYFHPHSAWHSGRLFAGLKSPEQVLMPDHGQSGASLFEENLHGIDGLAQLIDPRRPAWWAYSEEHNLGDILDKDFQEVHGGNAKALEDFFRQRQEGWKDRSDPTRYADDHEVIELLSNIAQKNIGGYSNHGDYTDPRDHREMEGFQSLINPYFTNPNELDLMWEMYPNAMQWASDAMKDINNIPDIGKRLNYLRNQGYFKLA